MPALQVRRRAILSLTKQKPSSPARIFKPPPGPAATLSNRQRAVVSRDTLSNKAKHTRDNEADLATQIQMP
jgi:hypothetical protein